MVLYMFGGKWKAGDGIRTLINFRHLTFLQKHLHLVLETPSLLLSLQRQLAPSQFPYLGPPLLLTPNSVAHPLFSPNSFSR